MSLRTSVLLLAALTGGCWGLAAAATAPAEVLGEPIPDTDPAAVQEIILTRLFDQFAAEQGIRAEPAEIDALIERMRADMAADGLTAAADLTPEEQTEADAMRRDMARGIIRQWKINKALYAQYGGRIAYQQMGPEPVDAYREFLRRRGAAGAFALHDEAAKEKFWRYFTDDSIHDFMAPGSADATRAFATPPWAAEP